MIKVPETRKGRRFALLGVAAAALVIFILYRKFFPEFDLQHLLDEFANFLGAWTYLVVGMLAFLETGAFVGLWSLLYPHRWRRAAIRRHGAHLAVALVARQCECLWCSSG